MVSFSLLQFDENIRLIIRHYDQASSEPEKSPAGEGRSLKPETPEPDGDSNQERAKDRGKDITETESRLCKLITCITRNQSKTLFPADVTQATRERQPTPSWPRWRAALARRWRLNFRREWSPARNRPVVWWRSMSV